MKGYWMPLPKRPSGCLAQMLIGFAGTAARAWA